jgi:hypothetical protein
MDLHASGLFYGHFDAHFCQHFRLAGELLFSLVLNCIIVIELKLLKGYMKRWFSRDSVRVKVGIIAIVFLMAAGVSASMRHPAQHNTELNAAPAAQTTTQPDAVDVSEKPKISVTQTKIETTEEDIPYTTTQTYDGTLPKDTTVVRVEGANGKKTVRTEVKTKDGTEISRELISEDITVPPVAKVVAIGTKVVAKSKDADTGSCDSHYTPCIKKVGHDLDCKDIGYQVKLNSVGDDPYQLDADGDGIGCENYPTLSH